MLICFFCLTFVVWRLLLFFTPAWFLCYCIEVFSFSSVCSVLIPKERTSNKAVLLFYSSRSFLILHLVCGISINGACRWRWTHFLKRIHIHISSFVHTDVAQFYTSVPWPLLQITPWVEYSVVHLDFLFHLKGIYYNFSNFQSFTQTLLLCWMLIFKDGQNCK